MKFLRLAAIFCLLLAIALCSSAMAQTKNIETGVVVVGSGGAGLSAAVSAAQNGAKVVLLEKEPFLGGATSYTEGLFGLGTKQLKARSVAASPDELFHEAMDFNHWTANAAVIHRVIDESGNTIRWLEALGVGFGISTMSPIERPIWHVYLPQGELKHGHVLVGVLARQAKQLGVKTMVSTPAEKLIVENGKVVGVEAIDANKNKVVIRAKAVILATGGFPNSPEMIKKWTPFDPAISHPVVPIHKTGDGINMAIAAGAVPDQYFGLMMGPGILDPKINPMGPLFTLASQSLLMVNSSGDRFFSEDANRRFTVGSNAQYRQPGGISWIIFDDNTVSYYQKEGIELGVGDYFPAGTTLDTLPQEIEAALTAHAESLASGTTIEELAQGMGVEPAHLRQTIETYNGFAAKNHDDQFAKDPAYLRPVQGKRYYALRTGITHLTSIGGIKTNDHWQAVDKNEKPIPGLYITGSDVGGLYGDTYNVMTSGFAIGSACTSGRLAGVDAAKLATK